MNARVLLGSMLPLPAAAAPPPMPASHDEGFAAVLQRAGEYAGRRHEGKDAPAPRPVAVDRNPSPQPTQAPRAVDDQPAAQSGNSQPKAQPAQSSVSVQDQTTDAKAVGPDAKPKDLDQNQSTSPPLDPALLALLTTVAQAPAQTPVQATAVATSLTPAPQAAPVQSPAPVLPQGMQAQMLAVQTQAQTAAPAPSSIAPAPPSTAPAPSSAATAPQSATATANATALVDLPAQAAAPAAVPQPALAAQMAVSAAKASTQTPPKSSTFGDLLRLVQSHGQAAAEPALGTPATIDPTSATLMVGGNGAVANTLMNAKGEVVIQVSGPRLLDPAHVVNQVANSLQVNLADGVSEVRMKLQPEHLGDVILRLMVNGNNVQAHAVVSSDAVQQALESQVSQLRRQLSDSGLNLTGFSVSVGGESLGQAFQQSRRDQSGRQPDAWAPVEENERVRPAAMAVGQSVRNPRSRIDTRA